MIVALRRTKPCVRFDGTRQRLAAAEFGLLPHVLMSAYERWTERAVESDDLLLNEFFAQLEEAYTVGRPEVEELISVSFLEHLPRPGERGGELRARVGPNLARQLRVIG